MKLSVNLLNTQLQLPNTDKFVLAFKYDAMLNNISYIYLSLNIIEQTLKESVLFINSILFYSLVLYQEIF